jgi:hypothetical protein
VRKTVDFVAGGESRLRNCFGLARTAERSHRPKQHHISRIADRR